MVVIIITSLAGVVAKYSDQYVCVFVCLWGYLRNHTRDIYQFFDMLPMVVARSTSGVVAVRYVMYFRFFIMGRSGTNFATKDRLRLNLLIYSKKGGGLV